VAASVATMDVMTLSLNVDLLSVRDQLSCIVYISRMTLIRAHNHPQRQNNHITAIPAIMSRTGVWRTGMSTVPAVPPIKYVLGYQSRTGTLTLTLTLKITKKENETGMKLNIELYLKVDFL